MMVTCTDRKTDRKMVPAQIGITRGKVKAPESQSRTFSLLPYSDLRVVKTGGQPLLKFILRYLSRHSRNFSPGHKGDRMC